MKSFPKNARRNKMYTSIFEIVSDVCTDNMHIYIKYKEFIFNNSYTIATVYVCMQMQTSYVCV